MSATNSIIMGGQDKLELIYRTLVSVFRLLDDRLPSSASHGHDRHVTPGGGLGTHAPTSEIPAPTKQQQTGLDPEVGDMEDELMTIKQAYLEMNVSRSTIDQLRRDGMLTSFYMKKNVRLLRSEVEKAKIWYSQKKGKL